MNHGAPEQAAHSVLLVSGDDGTRAAYRHLLGAAGYAVEEASDGPEGLARAIGKSPGFVITEARLAGIDGYQLCQLLRSDRDTRGAALIILTDGRQESHEQARRAGADAVLEAPCPPGALLREITRLHGQKSEGSPRIPVNAKADRRGAPVRPDLQPSVRSTSRVKSHLRYHTTTPPTRPPELVCPICLQVLGYQCSFVGGVSASFLEQWDEFTCARCGAFEYRQRTGRLRAIARSPRRYWNLDTRFDTE